MPNLSINEWLAWLRAFYDQYGYSVVFLGSLGENTAFLGLLLPGNSLVLLGAFYARLGTLNLGLVILWAALGTIVGYHSDYFFGRLILVHVASRWSATRLGRRLRLAGRLRLARMFLKKHGGKAILISHLIGHLRSIVAIGAGMMRMPYLTFLTFEILAATIWNTLYALLGYFIAVEIDRLAFILQRAGWAVFGLLVVLFLAWRLLGPRMKRRRRRIRNAHRLSQQGAKDHLLH